MNFRTDEEDREVQVQRKDGRWVLTMADQEIPLDAEQDTRGRWLVDTHQGRRRLWVAVRGDERLVFCEGKVHTFRLPDPEHDDAEDEKSGGPNLLAAMPGKIVRVLAGVGARVEVGQTLVIMESMKMETEITASMCGEIAGVHVQDGQVVAQGDLLVSIVEGE
ncbi:MAG: biotin/lipoyl-binding protein [bacterium]|nr:biotin/lipoyl-binding protein [bacterium]